MHKNDPSNSEVKSCYVYLYGKSRMYVVQETEYINVVLLNRSKSLTVNVLSYLHMTYSNTTYPYMLAI
jgi:hypothetical protein